MHLRLCLPHVHFFIINLPICQNIGSAFVLQITISWYFLFFGTGQGYVKNVTPKGCFIMLSRNVDAKILLSNLSDGYVKDLENEFPVGRLVIGK